MVNHTVVLKDNRTIIIRTFTLSDLDALVSMYASLSAETVQWGLPPYDRAKVERFASDLSNKLNLVAWSDSKIIGHLQIYTLPWTDRFKGVGELLIYLHQDFQNVGLGTIMMREAIEIARTRGWHRIGLTVIADNQRAVRSYEKAGFKIEGTRKQNYFGGDGKYHDSIEMGLLL